MSNLFNIFTLFISISDLQPLLFTWNHFSINPRYKFISSCLPHISFSWAQQPVILLSVVNVLSCNGTSHLQHDALEPTQLLWRCQSSVALLCLWQSAETRTLPSAGQWSSADLDGWPSERCTHSSILRVAIIKVFPIQISVDTVVTQA